MLQPMLYRRPMMSQSSMLGLPFGPQSQQRRGLSLQMRRHRLQHTGGTQEALHRPQRKGCPRAADTASCLGAAVQHAKQASAHAARYRARLVHQMALP